jgi:hypothetical protein
MPTIAGIKLRLKGTASPIPLEELERCERLLNATFPPCYRKFITEIGSGSFLDVPIRVFPPAHVCATTAEDQERLNQYWFWHESAAILPPETGAKSIQCFDTDVGHDLRFVPTDPSRFYFMSRHDESITVCRDLSDVLPLVGIGRVRRLFGFAFQPWPNGTPPASSAV